ncbi:MAG TPA: hypothetical protein PK522_00885 [Nitrosomonas sp.]|nr:hypothetical protein [Nitrosomonas sp.]
MDLEYISLTYMQEAQNGNGSNHPGPRSTDEWDRVDVIPWYSFSVTYNFL